MPASQTSYEHVSVDENNVSVISGTTLKVVELIQEKIAYGWSAEELLFQHPTLTLGQIYSALAYYADHQDAFDGEIEQQIELINKARRSSQPSPLLLKLKSKGLI